MSNPSNYCGTNAHHISRRAFLSQALAVGSGSLLGSSGAIHALDETSINDALRRTGRSVILLWLAGGSSQLETWDPKPGRPTGGPYDSIPTSVPGVHISELMPKMAKRMHRTAIIRSLNTRDGGHGTGAEMMLRGRKNEAALQYPDLGSIIAKELGRADSRVPGYVSFYSQTEGRGSGKLSPAFLGARYAPMNLDDSTMPPNLTRLEAINDLDHRDRARLRDLLSARFSAGRETETMRSHASAYARVHGLMSSEPLFDIEKEPRWMRNWYGPSLFGQQALMARRMVEAGVSFVRVSRAWWDSHGQNFETHAEMVPELDHVMATLLDDLDQRGLLESTLVVAYGEFGRTPTINASLGRDHFADAWSAALYGCGIQGGAVWGKTDEDGRKVVITQGELLYDDSKQVIAQTQRERFDDATGTGPLHGPNGDEPRSRDSHIALYSDPVGRQRFMADFGTAGGAVWLRPALHPDPSDVVLVSEQRYAADGGTGEMIDPQGIVRLEIRDAAGRRVKLLEGKMQNSQ